MYALQGFVKNFCLAIGIKCMIEVAMKILKKKFTLDFIAKQASIKTLLFGLFGGGYLGFFRLILCNMRKLRKKDDGINPALAGFLASFWLAIDKSRNRRVQIACYLFARSLGCASKNVDSNNLLEQLLHKILPNWFGDKVVRHSQDSANDVTKENNEHKREEVSWFETTWVISLSSILTAFALCAWFYEIDVFPHGVEKAMRIMTQPKPNDWNLVDKVGRVYAHRFYNSPMKTSRYTK